MVNCKSLINLYSELFGVNKNVDENSFDEVKNNSDSNTFDKTKKMLEIVKTYDNLEYYPDFGENEEEIKLKKFKDLALNTFFELKEKVIEKKICKMRI